MENVLVVQVGGKRFAVWMQQIKGLAGQIKPKMLDAQTAKPELSTVITDDGKAGIFL